MIQRSKEQLIKIKRERPLILNLTQYFPVDLIVSGVRSLGAMPITSNAEQEIEELLIISKSVVINLGKLDDEFISLCERVCSRANQVNKPIILDPTGAGATRYRTDTVLKLINKYKISIIRGYPSEIDAILNEKLVSINTGPTANDMAIENARLLSEKYNMAVVVSGKINSVIDSDKVDHFNLDHTLLFKVAGISSLLSSLVGTFHAIEENRFSAAIAALSYYEYCVGMAYAKANGPGSFKTELIDQLYRISEEAIEW